MQAARGDDLGALLFDLRSDLLLDLLEFAGGQHLGRLAGLLEPVVQQKIGIAAEQNVGAAAGHVGGNRHRAFAPGLRDDMGFALVVLGVQHFVVDAHLL